MTTHRSFLPGVFLGLCLGLSTGCEKKVVGECSEDQPCDAFATCVDGECLLKKCSTAADCGMEAHCDNGECAEGCKVDSDCYPGDSCGAEGNCRTADCRETSVDCSFGQYCDVSTGDCYNATGVLCSTCSDNADCGGNGNYCINFGANGRYCGTECSYDSDCPAGYMCLGLRDEFGNVFTTQCATYCWLYADDLEGPPPPDAAGHADGLPAQQLVIDAYDGIPVNECISETR